MTLSSLRPEEVEALCSRFKVLDIPYLEVTFSSSSMPGLKDCVKVEGSINAMVVQNCAVTGEAFPTSISTTFESVVLDSSAGGQAGAFLSEEDFWDVEEADENGYIDIGEIAAQYLSLEINPYPTAPGASLDFPQA